jgi:protein-tyrosine phosphatase
MTKKILVVCSGNICRSPMAEGILRTMLANRRRTDVLVQSAGTLGFVGAPPADEAVRACAERDVDISAQRSSALNARILSWADVVLGMEEHHLDECRRRGGEPPELVLLGDYGSAEDPRIDDPVGRAIGAFRECRDRLFECAERFLDEELGD